MPINPKRLYEKDYQSVINALIEFYNERPDNYGLMERPQEVYENYAKYINKYVQDKNSVLLDLGSGSWRIPDTIAGYGFKQVIGLDYFSDEKLNEYSKEIKNSNAELVQYENGKIPFGNGYFDCISSLCVLEHIVHIRETLDDMDRVLKPGGFIIIQSPNWSGINVYLSAVIHFIKSKDRFWQLNTFWDAFFGVFRSIKWFLEVLLAKEPKFILTFPRMKQGKIDFERSDDDAVHLCQPLSFKKYFRQKGYEIIEYNRNAGVTPYSKFFNKLFPSMATTNEIVVRKPIGK
ncbi:MAG: class I SAM-dependent methyltransferase [Candidatus Kapabacteria bacterium]|nr:class I SAM-dependent methyltransferase [Candidatus Kapabacteria bacterium]